MHPKSSVCKACGATLIDARADSYSSCQSCGSANYVSCRSAEDDNRDYFNSVYSGDYSDIIERRSRLFVKFGKIHSIIYQKEARKFRIVLQEVSRTIKAVPRSVEVGFGFGDELISYLKCGVNIYGLDLSEQAVGTFKRKYPEYAARVFCSAKLDFPVDVVYSNALFEHLDKPVDFLENCRSMLPSDGTLIIRLPLIVKRNYTDREAACDINFWKPCHRVLYTPEGLSFLLEQHGFTVVRSATLSYFGYKVLSAMLEHGYHDAMSVRNPYMRIRALDSDWTYGLILLESLVRSSVCSDCIVIAKTKNSTT